MSGAAGGGGAIRPALKREIPGVATLYKAFTTEENRAELITQVGSMLVGAEEVHFTVDAQNHLLRMVVHAPPAALRAIVDRTTAEADGWGLLGEEATRWEKLLGRTRIALPNVKTTRTRHDPMNFYETPVIPKGTTAEERGRLLNAAWATAVNAAISENRAAPSTESAHAPGINRKLAPNAQLRVGKLTTSGSLAYSTALAGKVAKSWLGESQALRKAAAENVAGQTFPANVLAGISRKARNAKYTAAGRIPPLQVTPATAHIIAVAREILHRNLPPTTAENAAARLAAGGGMIVDPRPQEVASYVRTELTRLGVPADRIDSMSSAIVSRIYSAEGGARKTRRGRRHTTKRTRRHR